MTDVLMLVRELVLCLLIALAVILITRQLMIPYTLGLVVVGLLISTVGLIPGIHLTPDLLLFVFLPALLFEGSWSTSVKQLRANWQPIILLAVPGLLLEVVLIAVPLHFLTGLIWEDAVLLSVILSPTDPVAVLGLFRQLKMNEDLSTIIEGESLFNDGVAGSLYQTILATVLLSIQGNAPSFVQIWAGGLWTFVLQAGGGIIVGCLGGFVASRIMRLIDDHLIETTITIVTAYGVYLLADLLHVSGILAVILAGLILGSYGQRVAMSEETREVIDNFWAVLAFLANVLVFLLVGAQLNPMQFLTSGSAGVFLGIAGLVIVAVLLARFVMIVLLPGRKLHGEGLALRSWRFVLFWSGLRGALSLALVLALPLAVPRRDALIFSTYAVVLFTLLVQGLSLRWILRQLPGVHR